MDGVLCHCFCSTEKNTTNLIQGSLPVVVCDSIRGFSQSESHCSIVSFSKIKVPATQAHTGVELQIYSFLTSALDGCQRSASHPGHFPPGKERRCKLNWRVGGPKGSPNILEKERVLFLPGFEIRTVQYTVYLLTYLLT